MIRIKWMMLCSRRFEHVVLEAALNVVCSLLIQKSRGLSTKIANTLLGFQAPTRGFQDVIIKRVDELLPLKNSLDELRKRVKDLKRALTDTLNSDDDLKLMCLTDLQEGLRVSHYAEGWIDPELCRNDPTEKPIKELNTLSIMSIEMIFEVIKCSLEISLHLRTELFK